MVKYAEIAQNIIDAHPTSVHQLLMSKGISRNATPDVLLNAYRVFGKPLISDLTEIIYLPKKSSGFSEFTATSQPLQTFEASVTSGTEKKTIWDNLADIFDSVAKTTGTISETAGTARDIVKPANGQPNIFQTEEKKALQEAENKKFTTNLLIVSAIVIVILISLIVITRKK